MLASLARMAAVKFQIRRLSNRRAVLPGASALWALIVQQVRPIGPSLSPVAGENIDLPMKKAFEHHCLKAFVLTNGRDGGIRTHDPLDPIQVRYLAALRPD